MSRIFLTRTFLRWARKVGLRDKQMREAVAEMERGLLDADLGGGLYKKRVPLPGRGKRGGARTLVATNRGGEWYFIYGYAKRDLEDLPPDEISAFKGVAAGLLSLTSDQMNRYLADGRVVEITHESYAKER